MAPEPESEPTEGVLKILTSTGWREVGGSGATDPAGEGSVLFEQLEEPEVIPGAIWIRQEPL